MRFALRNKSKLIEAFDENYYNLLIDSLKSYFANNDNIQGYNVDGEKYQFIDVPNIQPHTESCFQFAIIKQQFDVLNLAYYSCIA